MVPRAAVCAERITEVLDTESSVRAADDPVGPLCADATRSSCATSSSATPARPNRCSAAITMTARAGPDDGHHRQHRRGQDDAAVAGAAADRRHGRLRAGRRRRRPRRSTRTCCTTGSGWCPQTPYLFSGTSRSNLRYGKPDATDDELWRRSRSRRRATSSRRCRRGSTPRSPRAARTSPAVSASGSRSPARSSASREIYLFDDAFSALDLATDARLRAALRPITARRGRDRRRPARLDDHRRRPDRRARGRPHRGHRHARRAARDLPDVRGDRRVPAQRGGGGMSTGRTHHRPRRRRRPTLATTARPPVRRGPGGGGGPWGGMGMPTEKSMDFGPSARRLMARLRPERVMVLAVIALAVASVTLNVIGPRLLGRATDLIFAGVIGRQLPSGTTQAEAIAARTSRGDDDVRRRPVDDDRRARAGHRLRRARPGAPARAGALRRRVAARLAAGLPAERRRPAHRAPAAGRRRGQAAPPAAAVTSTGSRAASCSAGSRTTSTTSRRACSRR